MLKVKDLSHKYATSWAVRDINFEINDKGVVGLLGANGAGKSTIMNIITGSLLQSSGDIFINGVSLSGNPLAAKSQIGFLPQYAPLYKDFTIKEYLQYVASLRQIKKQDVGAAVHTVMEKTGLSQLSSRLIKNLSGGYKQRVGIAQAIIHKPGLVILDEPTNGLDPNQILEMRKLIKEIALESTVLLSSHVLSEINVLCRDVIMIERGTIVFSDSMEAFNNYAQSNTILLTMENLPDTAAFLSIRGITSVEIHSNTKCRLFFDGSKDISKLIVAASVNQRWRLKEMVFEKSQLEHAFKLLSTETN